MPKAGGLEICEHLSQAPSSLGTLIVRFKGQAMARVEKAMTTYSSTLAWKIPWTE